jgi:hypothetical protein
MNVVGLKYTIAVPGHTIGLASTIASVIELVEYSFASAGDYTSFDQDAAESTIKTALTTVATSWGTLLGVDPSLIQAGLVITRTWTFAGPDWVSSQVLYVDTLAYP